MDVFGRRRIDRPQEESNMLKWTLFHLGQTVRFPPPVVRQFVENMDYIIDKHILRYKCSPKYCNMPVYYTWCWQTLYIISSCCCHHEWVLHCDINAIFQQIEFYRNLLIKAPWSSNTIWTFLFVCLLFTLTWYQSVKTMYYNILNASTIEQRIIS